MPRRHDHDDLRLGRETGLEGVYPFVPQLRPVGQAVRLLPVLHRVVDNHQVRGVTGYAGHDAAADHAPHMVVELKFRGAVDPPDLNAEQVLPVLPDLFLVPPAEALRRLVVVTAQNHAPLRKAAKCPGRKRLGQRHGLAVLRRCLHDQDVIRVARVGLQERLDLVCQVRGHPGRLPVWRVHEGQIVRVVPSRQLTLRQSVLKQIHFFSALLRHGDLLFRRFPVSGNDF